MQDAAKIMVLAVLQGLTEFLPVSSSGHLVLGAHWLGLTSPGATVEVVLHAGTLGAILVYYRRRLSGLARGALQGDGETWRYLGLLALSTVPAVALYLAAGDVLEAVFDQPTFVGPALAVTGVLLLASRWFGKERPGGPVCRVDALWVGVAQAAAMLPGISRSGATLSMARVRGVAPREAAEFSFLMCVPLLAGATLLEVVKAWRGGWEGRPGALPLLAGAALAGLVGYVALASLIRVLARGRLWLFGLYCLALAAFAMLVCRA